MADSGISVPYTQQGVKIACSQIQIDQDDGFAFLRDCDPQVCGQKALADPAFSTCNRDYRFHAWYHYRIRRAHLQGN